MPDIASKLNPLFDGAALDADRVGETSDAKVMTAAERAAVAIATRYRGNVVGGSANDLVVSGMYIIGANVADTPAGATSGLLLVDSFGDFVRQTMITTTSSQVTTQYQRLVRPSTSSYPGWVVFLGAVADASLGRSKLASAFAFNGGVSAGSANDLTAHGVYAISDGVTGLPAGVTSGLMNVENYGDFIRQTIATTTNSQLTTQYQRVVRPSTSSYPGWVTILGALADASVTRTKLATAFSLNGTVAAGSANALASSGVYVVSAGVTDLPTGVTAGLLEVQNYGDFARQTVYTTTSSAIQTKYERIIRTSTNSFPGWTQVNVVARTNLTATFATNGTVSTGSFNDYFAEGTYVVGAALTTGPADADTPTTGLLSVRSWGGTFVLQEYVGTNAAQVLTKWQRLIRPGTSYGAWFRTSAAAAKSSRWSGRSVAFIGDSITRLFSATWPVSVTSALGLLAGYQAGMAGCTMGRRQFAGDTYNSYLQELGFTRLIDAMVSGDWTAPRAAAQYLSDNGQDAKLLEAVNILAAVNFAILDALVIGFGTNDFGCALPIGADTDQDWTTFKGAVNYGLKKIMTEFPSLRILVWTPLWRARQTAGDGKESDANPNASGIYLTDYGDALISRCKALKVPVLDMYRVSGINSFNAGTMFTDGLHPYTGAGNARMADKVASFMEGNY